MGSLKAPNQMRVRIFQEVRDFEGTVPRYSASRDGVPLVNRSFDETNIRLKASFSPCRRAMVGSCNRNSHLWALALWVFPD